MEPKILLIGKNIDSLEVLKEELIKFDRYIKIANNENLVVSILDKEKIDMIIVGAGLPDNEKDKLVSVINNIAPDIGLYIMEKSPGLTPVSMIGYTNEKAIMWKLIRARKK